MPAADLLHGSQRGPGQAGGLGSCRSPGRRPIGTITVRADVPIGSGRLIEVELQGLAEELAGPGLGRAVAGDVDVQALGHETVALAVDHHPPTLASASDDAPHRVARTVSPRTVAVAARGERRGAQRLGLMEVIRPRTEVRSASCSPWRLSHNVLSLTWYEAVSSLDRPAIRRRQC